MVTSNEKEIREAVKIRYAAKAVGAEKGVEPKAADCCSTAAAPGIYQGSDIVGLPSQVMLASAGCGNPTALSDLKLGETVVDLGSGGGIDCFLAARIVGPSGRVIGVDMTPEMLELARSNCVRVKANNVEFRQGEIENLPIDTDFVDVVISNCVVCLSPDKEAVFREAFRVLRKGGRLHISDMMLVGELPEEIRNDPKKWAECVSGADQKEKYLERLERAGFSEITIQGEERHKADPSLENLRSVYVRAVKSR